MVESVRTITIDRARLPVAVIAGSGSGAMPSLRGSADRSVPSGDSEASARTGAATSNTRVQAVEVTVRLDNGEPRAVVQDPDQKFAVGERVRLVYEGGEVRLIR
jgi:outer membrane lipoprotein SlyB